jgi:hypothetical protein
MNVKQERLYGLMIMMESWLHLNHIKRMSKPQ